MTSASLPSAMKGVLINRNGGIDVLEYKSDIPVPKPNDHQVLVRNTSIGVNFIDTYFRTGLYPAPSFPYILGREASGVVVSVPTNNPHNLKEGDRVVYISNGTPDYGPTYAEYTVTPAARAVRIPDGVDEKKACAALLQGITAITLVRETHPVKKGDWVLVHAAAGGVGLLLVQILRAIGAHVIATASTDAKRKLAKDNGAEVTIGYGDKEVKDTVEKYTDGKGVAAVFDGVGKATFETSLAVVARKGTLASFGNASGAVEPFAISRLAGKNIKIARPTLFNYITTQEEFDHYVKEFWDFVVDKGVNVKIHDVYPLSEAGRAHTDIEGRGTTGKLLLDPSK